MKTLFIATAIFATALVARSATTAEDIAELKRRVSELESKLLTNKPSQYAPRAGSIQFADGKTQRFSEVRGASLESVPGSIHDETRYHRDLVVLLDSQLKPIFLPIDKIDQIKYPSKPDQVDPKARTIEIEVTSIDGTREKIKCVGLSAGVIWEGSIVLGPITTKRDELWGLTITFDRKSAR